MWSLIDFRNSVKKTRVWDLFSNSVLGVGANFLSVFGIIDQWKSKDKWILKLINILDISENCYRTSKSG